LGFVKENQYIENWLASQEAMFCGIKDSEYRQLLKNWRHHFESAIKSNYYVVQGDKAMLAIEDQLPCNIFIFNLPGSKLLPASTSLNSPTYGYFVDELGSIDRELLNYSDAILCDNNFKFTCVYTHEWQTLALPKYYEDHE
jgi:hypothetical protein